MTQECLEELRSVVLVYLRVVFFILIRSFISPISIIFHGS